MLQRVHAEAGGHHQDHDDKHGGDQLRAFALNNVADDAERVVICVDAEESEKPHDSEQAEGCRAGGEEDGQIIGQERQNVHDAAERGNVLPQGAQLTAFGVAAFCGPETQYIVHSKKCHGHGLNLQQKRSVRKAAALKGIENAGRKVDDDGQHVDDVVSPTDVVIQNADFNDVEQPQTAGVNVGCTGHRRTPSFV